MALVLTGVAGLETLLPAATIAAVAGAPGGLTTAATQVYVARERRKAPAVTSAEAWWRPLDPVELEGGLGRERWGYLYTLSIEKASGTEAEMRAWVQALKAYFHGFRRPLATGLWACVVEALVIDVHPQQGPTVAVRGHFRFEEL